MRIKIKHDDPEATADSDLNRLYRLAIYKKIGKSLGPVQVHARVTLLVHDTR